MQDESLREKEKARPAVFLKTGLLAYGGRDRFIGAAAAAYVDSQAFNFLVQRREGNHKTLGGFGLIPAGAFEHVYDNAALDLVHDSKQRRLRVIGAGT